MTPAAELMARAQQGDQSAFDDLVRIHYRSVYSYALRTLQDRERAFEVTQETFVRAYRYRASFETAAGSVQAWVFAIAANRIRDAFRARAEEPAPLADLSDLPAAGLGGLEAYSRRVLREEIQEAVAALAPDQREIIALKYLSDMTYKEVAEVLGISVSAAKMRALRAREVLARSIARLIQSSEGECP